MGTNTEDFYLNMIKLGKKLEAVQVYIIEHKCGLAEAKEYIDNLEKINLSFLISKTSDGELINLLQSGKKIQAIKLYRNNTNASLKASKEYVESLERSGNITPNKSGKTKFEGCFIATVCYGGYDTNEVIEFRRFRDEVLLKSLPGKIFVKMYYRFSPRISKVVSKSETLKVFIRKYFLNKILNCINHFK